MKQFMKASRKGLSCFEYIVHTSHAPGIHLFLLLTSLATTNQTQLKNYVQLAMHMLSEFNTIGCKKDFIKT